jgi:hypothetical protein
LHVLKASIFRVIAAGLVGILLAGSAWLGTGAVAAAATAQPSRVQASMTLNEVDQIAAMLAGSRPARIGWLIPVQCYCLFADEQTFQDTLAAVFSAAAPLDHLNVRVQPNTYIRLNSKSATRIPDIYYFRFNNVLPASGLGYINELKVGGQAMGRANSEAGQDNGLIGQGYGIGANVFDKGQYLPVTAGIWWFAPNVDAYTYSDFSFIAHLLSLGINVVYIEYDPGAQVWPRPEGSGAEAEDVQEIESGDATQAQRGLDDMIGPCIMACRI